MKHFIFGYGSLICPQSRAVTAPSLKDAVAEPAVISHIERTWSARVARCQHDDDDDDDGPDHRVIRGWTPMGVRFRRGAECNGVLIRVDEMELMRFDVREVGYVRRKIDLEDVRRHVDPSPDTDTLLANESSRALAGVKCAECRLVFEMARAKRGRSDDAPGDRDSSRECDDIAVWVYVQKESLPAEISFPITQSYVDIIMRGCLSISHDFARRFLQTTHGWWHDDVPRNQSAGETGTEQSSAVEVKSEGGIVDLGDGDARWRIDADEEGPHHTWVNDRRAPMYVRADSEYSMKNGREIDELIKEHHPHALLRRVDYDPS